MANIKDFIKKIGNSAVSLQEQQQALAQVEQTIIEAKQKRTEAVGKNADMVIQALKTIEAKLEAKLTELNNTPAKQGVQGPAGQDGKDGKNGQDGRDGISGKDGTDGKDGVDGQDGVSVVDAKIDFDGSLVVYLSNGSEIDCGQILQPEVAKNIIISSGGSGTSQVVTDTLVSLQNQINTLTGIDGVLGDMAQQNANAVAITGGTINGTTIGATTPSSVNATTITGQTGVLRGTGTNLLTFSQTFSNAIWSSTNATATDNSATAPDGSSTAALLTRSGTSNANIAQTGTRFAQSYVASIYAKAGTQNFLAIQINVSGTTKASFITFNLTNGAIGTEQTLTSPVGMTATATNVGSGWYRCSVIYTGGGSDNFLINPANSANTRNGDNGGTIYIWGSQLEVGNTLNTYIPTTTTAVYGTPTLSFSGVSTIGLESNGALFVQPAGTGALQAQATTSSATGGNARGSYAIDLQLQRGAAGQVASASNSTVVGGQNNSATGGLTAVVGGFNNTSSGNSAFVGGGQYNIASGTRGVVAGGDNNTAAGFFNFIGSGFTNSGTANASVTTQSGTMNATTAVTLSGSNANIKVGQYITGTSIAQDTYVAAISGTALTLSKVASGSSTSTLSFFTPHGVVVGGGNNQATGSYSFIGGGGDAGTAAQRNTASNDWSTIVGGRTNTASGSFSFIGGGPNNTASGLVSSILGGQFNIASGSYSSVVSGNSSTASGASSSVLGGQFGTTRAIEGNAVFPASNAPITNSTGVSQAALLILARQTTDATPTALASNSSAAGTGNQVILPNNSAYFFRGEVISGVTGGGNTKGWTIEGVIKRGANAASTALVGTPTVTSSFADAGASTWVIAVTADTTNGGLRVTFTGQASTTIRTVCRISTVEMTF